MEVSVCLVCNSVYGIVCGIGMKEKKKLKTTIFVNVCFISWKWVDKWCLKIICQQKTITEGKKDER